MDHKCDKDCPGCANVQTSRDCASDCNIKLSLLQREAGAKGVTVADLKRLKVVEEQND